VWTSPPVKHAGRAGRDVPLAVGGDDREALTALEAQERGGARALWWQCASGPRGRRGGACQAASAV
jgi:hypothetical protein